MAAILLMGVLVVASAWGGGDGDGAGQSGAILPRSADLTLLPVAELAPGWKLGVAREMSEPVNALRVAGRELPGLIGSVFVGMAGPGTVARIATGSIGEPMVISGGLGDMIRYGTCNVNRLDLHDIDGDGEPELIGSTSQIHPRGRPKLCVWSTSAMSPTLRAVARPDIKSSWSHSLGYLKRPGDPVTSMFVTFCGCGEIVEYRLSPGEGSAGFHGDNLDWKLVETLPVSGEWIEVADADNDGTPDICVAAGFQVGQSEIRLYASDAAGAPLRRTLTIDEGHRFGNVRFTVADLGKTGVRDVVAWWCTDISGGDAEMIRYRLGPEGVRQREVLSTGPASQLWSDDGQFTTGDLDGNGTPELWFGTSGGQLWQYDPGQSALPRKIARFEGTMGPIAIGPDFLKPTIPVLYFGHKKTLATLTFSAACKFSAGG